MNKKTKLDKECRKRLAQVLRRFRKRKGRWPRKEAVFVAKETINQAVRDGWKPPRGK